MQQAENSLQQIHFLNQSKIFTHEEALNLVPLLSTITLKTKKELNNLNGQLAYFNNRQDKTNEIQNRINLSIQVWTEKMRRLGVIPINLGKVKIPAEIGQYFWEYPENKLYLN
jgi:hypothetical protein